MKAFVDAYAVVLPQTKKFHTTLMDSTYYELLRIYANELDREGTLLVSFGFSFGDSAHPWYHQACSEESDA